MLPPPPPPPSFPAPPVRTDLKENPPVFVFSGGVLPLEYQL